MRQDVCNLLDESFQSHRFRYVYPLRHVLGETGSGIRPSYLACYMYYSSMVLTLLELQSRFGDNWGHITWNVSALSPKRDWSSKGVNYPTVSAITRGIIIHSFGRTLPLAEVAPNIPVPPEACAYRSGPGALFLSPKKVKVIRRCSRWSGIPCYTFGGKHRRFCEYCQYRYFSSQHCSCCK